MEELCFLCGLFREVISKGEGQFSQFCTGVCEGGFEPEEEE
jgi:hypothetical protein